MLTTTKSRSVAAATITAGLLLGLGPTPMAQAATGDGTVYVVQGLTGDTLDVFVDGRRVRAAVPARSVVGPLKLAAGSHAVDLRSGSDVVARSTVAVGAGRSTDVVAHRLPDASRARGLTTFTIDTSAVPSGRARLVVAHMAAVPPADILVDGTVLVRNIANGESSTSVVPSGSYRVEIVPTLTRGPAVLGPTTLTVKAGTLTAVLAIGDPSKKTMDAVVQELPVGAADGRAPGRVDTGDGGQAAALFEQPSRPAHGGLAVFGGLALLAASGAALLRRRPRARAAGRR